MSIPSFTFTAENEADGFASYRDLYSVGSDVTASGARFHARVDGYHFDRLMLFERRLSGVMHSRSPARVRRDGYDHYTLQLLCEGSFQGGALGAESPLNKGEIILFDMTRPQRTLAEGAHFLTLSLPRDVVEASAPEAGHYHGRILPRTGSGLLGDLMRSLARRGDTVPDKAAAHVSRAVAELVAVAIGTDDASEAVSPARMAALRLERAQAFIDARLADPSLDAETVASGVAISRSVLYRLFVPAGGVGHYITTRRLEQMRSALQRPTELRSVSTLAYDLGFSNESHCSRAFRAAYGMPPGRYRAEMGGGRLTNPDGPPISPRQLMAEWVSTLY
ncbi:helix-turn-helix domain-containing protein [Methylobacterium haplocladii]|uniref:Transcriptional regulator n=1 Tax=Methylobacterium haplocladii TaxID=1176176 RepID=A0A512IPL2_9HYPH|nr:helix-turn-helix domain-containing protein [Methylobacterium haplocladii]GEO99637.1 transcriptional regulator [Methylobacterium haplocladii]GJD83331.1 hypothetical protein HPGCJGGD_1197 [Methylobacterium haplocladii]GLS58206.1 transcriptional regulator [Methylobacterium haplocladii]